MTLGGVAQFVDLTTTFEAETRCHLVELACTTDSLRPELLIRGVGTSGLVRFCFAGFKLALRKVLFATIESSASLPLPIILCDRGRWHYEAPGTPIECTRPLAHSSTGDRRPHGRRLQPKQPHPACGAFAHTSTHHVGGTADSRQHRR